MVNVGKYTIHGLFGISKKKNATQLARGTNKNLRKIPENWSNHQPSKAKAIHQNPPRFDQEIRVFRKKKGKFPHIMIKGKLPNTRRIHIQYPYVHICLNIYIYMCKYRLLIFSSSKSEIGCFLFPPRSPVKKVEWNTARKAQHFYTTNGPIPVTSAPERKSKEPRRLNEGNRWVETHNFVHGKHRDSSNSCLVNDYLVGGFNPFEKY